MNPIHRVEEQPAYILYARSFRETSLLLEVFSRDYGRVSLIAKGARSMTRSPRSRSNRPSFQSLQPFVPLLLSWYGRGTLFNLTHAEINETPLALESKLLVSGWYVNELLVRTLRHWDVYTHVFDAYEKVLRGLSKHAAISLRQFEKRLLTALGLMPQLSYDQETKQAVQPNNWYRLHPERGVFLVSYNEASMNNFFQGDVLLAIENNNFQQQAYSLSAKRLFRLMVDHVLEGKILRSRGLL